MAVACEASSSSHTEALAAMASSVAMSSAPHREAPAVKSMMTKNCRGCASRGRRLSAVRAACPGMPIAPGS
eukprot:10807021-Heterocapsa_arctica.AAC.1